MAPVTTKTKLSVEKETFLYFLNEVIRTKGYTITELLREMQKLYPNLPDATFHNTISEKKKNLNAAVVIAFCKTFGYDIYDIYRPSTDKEGKTKSPNTEPAIVNPQSPDTESTIVNPELPPRFYGTFHGYFFNSELPRGTIDRFTLDIQHDGIRMTLRHWKQNVKPNDICEIVMKGKVIHNQGGTSPAGIVVLSFNSEADDCFCTLAYNKFQLNGTLYFRRGALMISGRGSIKNPVLQSFIFTDEEIDLKDADKEKEMQGALKLTDKSILIEKSRLEPFLNSELLKKYFKSMSLDNACKEYVEIDESFIQKMEINDDELYQTLLNLKSESCNPEFYKFPTTDHSWLYIAKYLCNREEPLQE